MKKRFREVALCWLVVLSLAPAPAWGQAPPGAPGGPAPEKKEKPKVPDSAVLAKVNDRAITMGDFRNRLALLPLPVQIQANREKEKFLSGIIQTELLFQEAVRRGIDKSPYVQEQLRFVIRTLAVQELIRREVASQVTVSDAEVREHFERNPEEFSQKETVTLSHIVVPTLKEAQEALAELRKGRSFGGVARERSVFEGTRESGGVMGAVTRGQLQPELEGVAFRLKVGEVSEPVKTNLGYQILKVTERIPAAKARFEDVRFDIEQLLLERKRQGRYEKFLGELRGKAKLTVNQELLGR